MAQENSTKAVPMRWRNWITTNQSRFLLLLIVLCAAFLRFYQLDRLPPGLFYDEAFNGVDARRVIEGVSRPIFFHGNNGREALFIYLQSLFVWLLGYKAFALRLTSAFVGILTIPIIFQLTKAVFSQDVHRKTEGATQTQIIDEQVVHWAALAASFCVAMSYWHMSVSRLGFRAILLPLVSALAIFFFWRGWRLGDRQSYIWSGLWLGLALYTYTSARLLPFVIASFVTLEFILKFISNPKKFDKERRQTLRRQLEGLFLLMATALLLSLPLLYEMYRHPYLINARTQDVSIFTASEQVFPGSPLDRLMHNLAVVTRSFYDTGDINPRHNLPGRPVNDVLMAILFTAGSIAALVRLREARFRLVLIWFIVMVLPSILSVEAPHALRLLGILPAVAVFYGLGFTVLLKSLRPYVPIQRAAPVGLAILLVVSGSLTFYDYFFRWAKLPILGYAFDLRKHLAAQEAANLLEDLPNAPILFSRELYLTPQMRFAIGAASPDEFHVEEIPAARLIGGKFLFEDSPEDPNRAVILLWSPDGVRTATWVDPKIPDSEKFVMDAVRKQAETRMIQAAAHQEEWGRVVVGELPPIDLAAKTLQYPLDVRFANGMNLIGYEVRPDRINPDDEVPYFFLTLYWRDLSGDRRSPGEQFDLFTHLRFGNGQSQDNGYFGSGYGVSLWYPNEIVDTRRLLHVPTDAQSGKAFFEVGLYDPSPLGNGERVPILDGNGQIAGSSFSFGGVMIGQPPPQADISDLLPLRVTFDERITLVGWKLQRSANNENNWVVDLAWRALDRPLTDYTVFVHLINPAGEIVAQYDQPPAGTENPTRLWVPDELVRATFPLSFSTEALAFGRLRIRTGLYEPVSGRQAAVTECEVDLAECAPTYVIINSNESQESLLKH